MSRPGFRLALWLPVCAMAFARPSWGQESGSTRWRLTGAWLAVGPNAPFLTRLGTRHHDVYVLGLRAERALVQHGALQLYHTVDALPLAVSTAMPVRYDDGTCAGAPPQDQATCLQWVPHFGTVYGFGLAPVGLELRYAPHRRLRIVASAAVGALYFTQRIPDPMASRLNFSITGNVGVRIAPGSHRAIDVGYRFQHVSNGGLAFNPGMNTHMLQLGLGVR